MDELKRCPFCGGKMSIIENLGRLAREKQMFHPVCNNVDCGLYSGLKWYGTKEEAIAACNNRADGWIPVSERLPKRNKKVIIDTIYGTKEAVLKHYPAEKLLRRCKQMNTEQETIERFEQVLRDGDTIYLYPVDCELALAALRAQQERENPKPCNYCRLGIKAISMKFPTTHEYGGTRWTESVREPKFCPMCGRKLDHEPKEGK
jgi:molybdopterin converting factor small subunit